MPRVESVTVVSGRDSREMYELLWDTERFAQFTESIESLHCERADAATAVSTWRVRFRSGILQWTEADVYDRERLTIAFDQLDGDFASFRGCWSVEPLPQGCRVRFVAKFDFGMPTLAPMVDPIAEVALRESIGAIVVGLATAPRPALVQGPADTG